MYRTVATLMVVLMFLQSNALFSQDQSFPRKNSAMLSS